jgi:hypothetical protein
LTINKAKEMVLAQDMSKLSNCNKNFGKLEIMKKAKKLRKMTHNPTVQPELW